MPQQNYAPQAARAGGGFMAGALQTAAGVAGGVVLGNMLTNMFSGSHPQEIVNIIEENRSLTLTRRRNCPPQTIRSVRTIISSSRITTPGTLTSTRVWVTTTISAAMTTAGFNPAGVLSLTATSPARRRIVADRAATNYPGRRFVRRWPASFP